MQISQRLYASRMPSELSSTSDLMMEIAKREQEVSALREKGLNDLRAEVQQQGRHITCPAPVLICIACTRNHPAT